LRHQFLLRPNQQIDPSTVNQFATLAINIPADQLIPPDDITFEQGAAFPLQGITAHYIVYDYVQLQLDKTILVHAAARGAY
jgi:NADPH:quinone reductase-like Zn-dependent oxidoreductase